MPAYVVTYKADPRSVSTLTAVRFADTLDAARANAEKVLGREQGYTVVSVTPALGYEGDDRAAFTVEYFAPRHCWLVMQPGAWDICECRTEEDARRIAAALNAA